MPAHSKLQSHDSKHHHNDVTVIGGGWTGLVACKYMLEEGLTVVTLEKREGIGGVWLYTDDPSITTAMKGTQCTSSSSFTEMSDFPMPVEIGMFPKHGDVLQYLRSYAKHFNLMPHIQLNTNVKSVEKEGEVWQVECENGDTYTSTYLIVAAGVLQRPNRTLEQTLFQGFAGKVYHAREIKEVIEEHRNQRLLVVGGGETASDICMEWIHHSETIHWSIPRGQHFFRTYGKAFPWVKAQALDKASSRALKVIAPFYHSKPGLSWICNWTTNGSLLAYQGHGIPEWRNKVEFFHHFINKNGKVLDLVDNKHLIPKGSITGCRGKVVSFSDGTKQEFDLVIMCTGYAVDFSFLPKRYSDVGTRQRYKFVFDVQDPSLACLGLVRPVVGSVVVISELQARWVARVFSNRVRLQSLDERKAAVKGDIAHWNHYFKGSSNRIEGLVEHFTYTDDVAKLADVYPDYWSLLKRNPSHWYYAIFSPYTAATYRLNEPDAEDQAIATMAHHKRHTITIGFLFLIMFLRFIWFDWILARLSSVKYHIQVSNWWPTVREWRVTKAANWVWILPKSVLFDKCSVN